jgi:hypothetical protein
MDGTLFALGRIVATPGALKTASEELIIACIRRHLRGDWGELGAADKRTNDEAVCCGLRICRPIRSTRSSPAPVTATTRCGSSPRPTAA